MLTAQEIKRIACEECGADLVGIAPVERFAGLPPEANPSAIQPDAQSVIVMGFSIPRGGYRGIEAGTAWSTFHLSLPFGTILTEGAYLLCRALEREGWEATPIHSQSHDLRHQGVRVSPDKPEPNVILDLLYAAQAAGLGELGRGKFFLTPEFGPRQVFVAVLTDAALEPDAPFTGHVCDDCGACAGACPARALDSSRRFEEELPAGKAEWYPLHVESCRVCKTCVLPNPYSTGTEPLRLGAACARACVAHLEDEGNLSRRFTSRFRA